MVNDQKTIEACLAAFDGIPAPSEDARQWAKSVLHGLWMKREQELKTMWGEKGWIAYVDLQNGTRLLSNPIMPTEGEAVALLRMRMEDEGIKA